MLLLLLSCRGVPGEVAALAPAGVETPALPAALQVTFGDGTVDTASLQPGLDTPSVSRQRALAEAGKYVAGSAQATAVSARYVRLTLPRQTATDNNQPIQDRAVWIVSYAGVPFSGPQNCECAAVTAQPNTSVVLNATDGRLVAWFGSPPGL
jgi:hypothetical protein